LSSSSSKKSNSGGFVGALERGGIAGIVSLGFLFVLRLGGIAPFPPESALEAFLKIIPESIQEPSVQTLGDLAGQLGLFVATLIAILVWGICSDLRALFLAGDANEKTRAV